MEQEHSLISLLALGISLTDKTVKSITSDMKVKSMHSYSYLLHAEKNAAFAL